MHELRTAEHYVVNCTPHVHSQDQEERHVQSDIPHKVADINCHKCKDYSNREE
jgi:hypothetical protein